LGIGFDVFVNYAKIRGDNWLFLRFFEQDFNCEVQK
jgi:hypothetical protein